MLTKLEVDSRYCSKHAIRCILRERKDLKNFVDEAYTIEKYKMAYTAVFHPVQDLTFWLERNLPRLGPPPIEDIGPGRPETARRKDITEVRGFQRTSTIRCSQCGEFGHNIKSHKGKLGALVNKAKKRRRIKKQKRPIGKPPKEGSRKPTKKLKPSQPP